jgi:hypothetical protein
MPLIRYGAGQGRLLRSRVQGIIDEPLLSAASRTGGLLWETIPRRFNSTAHRLAQAARQVLRVLPPPTDVGETQWPFNADGLE